MILVTTAKTLEELSALQNLLERNGIPIYVDGVRAGRYNIASVSVYIDAQHADALALLDNPEHIVAHRVDVHEYYASIAAVGHSGILRYAIGILAVVVAVFLLTLLIFNK